MSSRDNLLNDISRIVQDYREEEINIIKPDHIDRWVSQFLPENQLLILREIQHVFESTYYSKNKIMDFLESLCQTKKLVGDNPKEFWAQINFLQIQERGNSQIEMLTLFDNCLMKHHKISISDCGKSNEKFIYLDDVIFSGFHVTNDLDKWIRGCAPKNAKIYICVFSLHKLGEYQVKKHLNNVIQESNKNILFEFWRCKEFENRVRYRNNSEVLWPCELPEDPLVEEFQKYNQNYPFIAREQGGNFQPFSSEAGRKLLEREFLMAGLKIKSYCKQPNEMLRPLGYSLFGLGFGSMIVTYRNCPNNSPLALWWGNPNESKSNPLSKWYPLFPRKINDSE